MIDWNKVRELRDDIGADDFDEVVELFLSEVEGALETLDVTDARALEEQMHFLKGSALNLGFEAMAQLCAAGEQAAANGDTSTVTAAQVKQVYAESRAEFLGKAADQLAA